MKYYWVYVALLVFGFVKYYYFPANSNSKLMQFSAIEKFKQTSINNVQKVYPSPHSELLLGMTLGIDELDTFPEFKEALKRCGTIHVVVVSGFNITLVFGFLVSIFGGYYSKKALLLSQVVTFFYCLIVGLEPPVLRAYSMTTLMVWGRFYGRDLNMVKVILVSGFLMLVWDFLLIESLSFQLSFLATLSVVVFSGVFKNITTKYGTNAFASDFLTTIYAQVLVWPVIAFNFSTFSLISFIANPLVLWTVSLSTVLGFIFIFTSFINYYLAYFVFLFSVPFLDFFIVIVMYLSKFSWAVLNVQFSSYIFILYYLICFVIYKKYYE